MSTAAEAPDTFDVELAADVLARQPIAYGLSDPAWGYRVFDQSYANLDAMAKWGYEWPRTPGDRNLIPVE